MDVTPRELRDIDIREGFRGYNRDDVDELLERAAATIEGLEDRARQLTEQMAALEGAQGKSRETEDILQRTLVLAQRAADEAVAEAQAKARQILDDAESQARATLAEAESTMRREAESERRRLESEVLELGARREALLADVESLERFEADYRARLHRALEADLESLAGQSSIAPSPRPTIHEVDLPAPPPPVTVSAPARPEPAAPVTAATAAPPATPPTPSVTTPPPGIPPLPDPGPATLEISTVNTPRAPLFDEEPPPPEALDDDAFFASLREAVTDDAPLGPRDDAADEQLFEDEQPSRGGLFRRRG